MSPRSHSGVLAALLVVSLLAVRAVGVPSVAVAPAVDRAAATDDLTASHPADAGIVTRTLRVAAPAASIGSAPSRVPLGTTAAHLATAASAPRTGAPLYALLSIYRL